MKKVVFLILTIALIGCEVDPDAMYKNWNTKRDGSGVTYHIGDALTIKNLDVFLYAVWEEESE